MRVRRPCVLLILFLTTSLVRAQNPAPAMTQPAFDEARHMRVVEVKPGMTGYGLTVFSGTKIERFDVSVIGTARKFGPQQDVVLIRCLGERLEHSGVVAGMSGSPIFLKDDQGRERMIGALAYGWSLSKDPIAGVQPIEYMLKLNATTPSTPATQPVTGGVKADASGPMKYVVETATWDRYTRAPDRFEASSNRLIPMTTPLMAAGLPTSVMTDVSPALASLGLVPLQAGGAAKPDDGDDKGTIAPGSALVVPLVTGDLDLSALGTCTEVVDDRVFGFGHPFQNEGAVALPMASGFVTTVIPSLSISFKLGGTTAVVGTLAADQSVGIAGTVGAAPEMIPFDLDVVYADGSMKRTFRYDLAAHPTFTPLLGTVSLLASLQADKQLPQYSTLDLDLSIDFRNGKTVHVANRAVNATAAEIFADFGTPVIAASENPFDRVFVKRIKGTLTVTAGAKEAQVIDVNLPRTTYLPGETVRAYVTYRPFRAAEAVLPVEMQIPKDLPDGTYKLSVADWITYLGEERASEPFRFTTENVDQVFAVLREMAEIRRNALYVRLTRQPDGVAVGRTAMPRLPSSRRQVLLGAGRSNTTAFVSSTVKVVPSDYVFTGSAEFDIDVDRNARSDRPRKHEPELKKLPAGAKPTTAPAS
jgi:hypothetical protein